MKIKHIIILAFIGFLILYRVCLKNNAPIIENTIWTGVNTLLQSNGISDVNVQINGRDVVLTGQVATREQLNLLNNLGKDITGVRMVNNQVLVVPVKPVREKYPRYSFYFLPGAFSVTAMHNVILKQIIRLFQTDNWIKLQVNGYTDSEGDEKFNLQLSEKRAKSVFDYLLENGIPVAQITMNYFGEAGVKTEISSLRQQAKNRKVEVIFFKEK